MPTLFEMEMAAVDAVLATIGIGAACVFGGSLAMMFDNRDLRWLLAAVPALFISLWWIML